MDFVQFLKNNNVKEEIINILIENDINDIIFVEIQKPDLDTMGIVKLSDVLLLTKLIKDFKVVNLPSTSTSDNMYQYNQPLYQNVPSQSSSTTSQHSSNFEYIAVTQNKYNNVFDIMSIIQAVKSGQGIIDYYNKNETLNRQNRTQLVNILMDDFIAECGYYNNYKELNNLATSIIITFPNLGQTDENENGETTITSDNYFSLHGGPLNAHSGYLYFRLQNMRKLLSPSKKKNTKRIVKPIEKINEENENLENLNCNENINVNIGDEKLVQNFKERKIFIKNSKSFGEILDRYPLYMKSSGEKISRDYDLFGFKSIDSPHIYIDFFLKKPCATLFADINDDFLKTICIISHLLAVNNNKKKMRWSLDNGNVNPALIKFLKEDSFEDLVKNNKHKQPHLLARFGNESRTFNFFLNIEDTYMDVGSNFQNAFITLFKSFFIFNFEYDISLKNFYNFISKILKLKVAITNPRVTELLNEIKHKN